MDAQTTYLDQGLTAPDSDHDSEQNGILKEAQRHKLLTAAIIGGAVAAGAGAFMGTRALARRNGAKAGQPLNSVMAAAITACDLNHTQTTPKD